MDKFRIGSRGETWKDKLRDLFFGFFLYGLHQQVIETSRKYKDILGILILGEAFGIPMLGNIYTIRLIPFFIEDLERIKKKISEEYDILELLHEGPGVH